MLKSIARCNLAEAEWLHGGRSRTAVSGIAGVAGGQPAHRGRLGLSSPWPGPVGSGASGCGGPGRPASRRWMPLLRPPGLRCRMHARVCGPGRGGLPAERARHGVPAYQRGHCAVPPVRLPRAAGRRGWPTLAWIRRPGRGQGGDGWRPGRPRRARPGCSTRSRHNMPGGPGQPDRGRPGGPPRAVSARMTRRTTPASVGTPPTQEEAQRAFALPEFLHAAAAAQDRLAAAIRDRRAADPGAGRQGRAEGCGGCAGRGAHARLPWGERVFADEGLPMAAPGRPVDRGPAGRPGRRRLPPSAAWPGFSARLTQITPCRIQDGTPRCGASLTR